MTEILRRLMTANCIESLDKPDPQEDAIIELAELVAEQEQRNAELETALLEIAELVAGGEL